MMQRRKCLGKSKMATLKYKASAMLRKANAGKRRRHTVGEVVDFLESLPAKVTADVSFVGQSLLRNDCTCGEDLYSISSIELTRIYSIRIFGWEYLCTEESGWDCVRGIIFARDPDKRDAQAKMLNDAFIRSIYTPDYSSDGNVTDDQIREALSGYECEHGDGYEPVFYRRSRDGELYLRDCLNPYQDEESYFEGLEPLDFDEAFEQFGKSHWTVYEEYDL